jgi:cobaltochelatase CobN
MTLPQLSRLFAFALALLTLPATAAHLLIVTTSPITPGKFRVLAEQAKTHGITVEARFIEKLDKPIDADFWRGADAVLFDAPRDHIEEAVRSKVLPALPALTESARPVLWMHTLKPHWQHLPDALGLRLAHYYNNGGAANNQGFLATLAAHLAGKPWQSLKGVAPPVIFPATAIYHPKAPSMVFSDTASYLKWKAPKSTAPLIAIAFHQQSIAASQLGLIDDLIARIEAAGATALAFYSPVMDNGAISKLLAPEGKPLAQVLINTQIMLNPEGRRKEFEALGIPVIQGINYKKGDEDAWWADRVGLPLMDVPFYLAQPEYTGIHDIQIASVTDAASEQVKPIAAQSAALVTKALNLARLARTDNADKRVTLMFWNYPAGEKNLGASFMNLPESLANTLAELKAAGYKTETPNAQALTLLLQRLLRPFYRTRADLPDEMRALLREGLAETLPLSSYRRWLETLPDLQREAWITAVGQPEKSGFVVQQNGVSVFVIPRLKLGHITVLPQPPRGEPEGGGWYARNKAIYHSTTSAPPHYYLATYLWTRHNRRIDALIHFGTHGTQEWLPGKERGLSVHDFPLLAVGDVPVIYPYIVDDIGEAVQAQRRGRALTISHQTPPFMPAGLHDSLTRLHDDLHHWLAQDDGAVKDQIREALIASVLKDNLHKDMGWTLPRIRSEFRAFIDVLHDHLHELAQTAQPLGLHTFGKGSHQHGRLATVLMMLGAPYWEATATHFDGNADEADEAIIADYAKIAQTAPYRLLKNHLVDGAPTDTLPKNLRDYLAQGQRWYTDLQAKGETNGLIAALAGRYIPTSYGNDPIKNPDSLPTGRNLYAFDPSRVPTKAAWAAGQEALDKLVAAHTQKTGKTPKKLTFTLWSVETMRHQGLLEAQALWAMGVEPVWDAGGRVIDVKLVPRKTLGRARIDVVLSATGLYRDHFPNAMKQLAKAAQLAANASDEPDNIIAQNSRAIATTLTRQGWQSEAAARAGATRIFSGESGSYGSGLDDAALATDTWKSKAEGDKKMAELYLRKMQFAYGPLEADWGKSGETLAHEAGGTVSQGQVLNLYAAHLKGTEGAVLARSSNLYGMLTTDDPFQYLGGISAAVRHLDGKAPELFISNLRGSGSGKAEGADAFLAKELQTRQFHPGYIKNLMAEGYSGSLEMLDALNNFTGWTTVAREIVRDDQWQQYAETYVNDKHKLGLAKWFEAKNPHALAQMIERMIEMERQGYWKTDAATTEQLKARYRELAQRHDVRTSNTTFQEHVGLPGYGLSKPVAQIAEPIAPTNAVSPALTFTKPPSKAPPPDSAKAEPTKAEPAPSPLIKGMKLEQVPPAVVKTLGTAALLALALLLLTPAIGAWRQWRHS